VLLAVTTLSFDIAALELFLPLTAGARVVLAGSATAMNPGRLAEMLSGHSVTVLQATPTAWRLLLDSGWNGRPGLKALCGGEPMPADLAARLKTRCAEVWNMYGPTETTVWSCIHRIDSEADPVPIGRPIANTSVYLLDTRLRLVPTGTEGEIFIGGEGLANGYLDRAELTAERFIPHPFLPDSGGRLYRTGDLGRYLPNGQLVCCGRTDHQIKLRGFRIELEEIESLLNQHPAIQVSVVQARQAGDSEKQLVAYYVGRAPASISAGELRDHLSQRLPDYMVPAAFVPLADLPVTPNGKVDRARLPDPAEVRPEVRSAYIPPRTPLEEELAGLWQEVLRVERIGVQDDFFELGGHSLLALRIVARLRHRFQLELSPALLFDCRTIEKFALRVFEALLEKEEAGPEGIGIPLRDAQAAEGQPERVAVR
jgi:acyl-CoA synthetase (AMP-forming)/AMP-acid ligase II/acyl carrier protein